MTVLRQPPLANIVWVSVQRRSGHPPFARPHMAYETMEVGDGPKQSGWARLIGRPQRNEEGSSGGRR